MICEFPLPALKFYWVNCGRTEGRGRAECPIEFIFYALTAEATKIADERCEYYRKNR